MKNNFTLEYWEDEGWFVGRLVEVPGVFSQGATLDELEENIKEAYELMIQENTPIETGKKIHKKQVTIVAWK